MAGHLLLTTTPVATVVGWKDALLGLVPFSLLNFYNKSLYLWVFVREWLLGIHYTAWTGRHERSVRFTKANPIRIAAVCLTAGILVALLLQR
jgi:hypothetical protein